MRTSLPHVAQRGIDAARMQLRQTGPSSCSVVRRAGRTQREQVA
ncbi:hypothetical protein ACFUZA_31470 [Streptomyces cellulosae]